MLSAGCFFDKHELVLLLVVCLGLFTIPMTITSSSIFDLAIMSKFSLAYSKAQWFIAIFMIFYAAFMAVTGALSDIYGRIVIYRIGLLLMLFGFSTGAILNNYIMLLISRAVCGIGAAAVTTAGTSLLASNIKIEKKEQAFSIFGCALGISMVSGPLIAAYISQKADGWHVFTFLMSCLLVATYCATYLSKDNSKRQLVKVDWLGGVLLTVSLLCLVFILSFFTKNMVFNFKDLAIILIGLLSFIAFLIIERKTSNPIIDFKILQVRKFKAMCMTTLLLGFGYISILFYFPYYLKQNALLNNISIGWAVTISTLPSLIFPILISKFKQKISNNKLLIITIVCLAVSPAILCLVIHSHSFLVYIAPLFIFGVSFGISLSFIDGEAVNSVDTSLSGIAAGTFNTFRIGGESISIPLLGAISSMFIKNKNAIFHNVLEQHAMMLTLITVSVICIVFGFYVLKTICLKGLEIKHEK